jgi:hypothetical protein
LHSGNLLTLSQFIQGQTSEMASIASNLNFEEIKAIILELPPQDLVALSAEIDARLQTLEIMQLAETSFQEWHDEEEWV